MTKRKLFFLILFLVLTPAFMTDAARLKELPEVIKAIQPSVVNVQTDRSFTLRRRNYKTFLNQLMNDFFEQKPFKQKKIHYKSEGSGVVLDKDGMILTNAHVVSGASSVKVILNDKKEFKARVVSRDRKHDLALLKIDANHVFKPIKMIPSEKVAAGQTVVAIGTPYSYAQTVTKGIVSAVDRTLKRGNKVLHEGLIQTDAAANPGSSGGPLLTEQGEMIGVMFAGDWRSRAINFAIPSSKVKELLPELKQNKKHHERLTRFQTKFGLSISEVNEDSRVRLNITDVLVTSDAYKNGIRNGDVLIQFGEQLYPTSEKLFEQVEKFKKNERIYLKVKRNGRLFFTYIKAT